MLENLSGKTAKAYNYPQNNKLLQRASHLQCAFSSSLTRFKHSGNYMYHMLLHLKTVYFFNVWHVSVFYNSQNKQRLFP
jgi:hypothetical protein